jgi:uncharacterized protein (TIGR00255 family)
VNGKTLDIRCRVPSGYDRLDMAARKAVGDHLRRGNVSLNLNIDTSAQQAGYRINQSLLDEILSLKGDLGAVVADQPPTLEGLLAIRGMIEPAEQAEDPDATEARDLKILDDLATLLDELSRSRSDEGAKLAAVVGGHLDGIADLVARAAVSAEAQPAAIANRLRATLDELLDGAAAVDTERLAQEVALLAGRADVREELDRLAAHLEAARELLAETGPVGRKFDFLCQEFNREANTLVSKASDMELHGIGLELKSVIDQLREQIQNIE